jgi:hypothetical protein
MLNTSIDNSWSESAMPAGYYHSLQKLRSLLPWKPKFLSSSNPTVSSSSQTRRLMIFWRRDKQQKATRERTKCALSSERGLHFPLQSLSFVLGFHSVDARGFVCNCRVQSITSVTSALWIVWLLSFMVGFEFNNLSSWKIYTNFWHLEISELFEFEVNQGSYSFIITQNIEAKFLLLGKLITSFLIGLCHYCCFGPKPSAHIKALA